MSGGGQQTQQTTQVQLSPEQQQLLNMSMPFAKQYAEHQPTLPTTSQVAGFTAPQVEGQQTTLDAAHGALADTARSGAGAHEFLTSGAALDPATNPGLQAAIRGVTQPMQENFMETVIPAIRSAGTAAGPLGSREGIAEGIAAGKEERAEGGAVGSLVSQNYQNALDQMTRAMGLTPTVQQGELEPGVAESSVGDVQQQLEQQKLTEAFNKYMYPQLQPMMTAEQMASLASGIPGGGSTTTGSATSQSPAWQQALGYGTLASALLGSGGIAGGISSLAPLLAFI